MALEDDVKIEDEQGFFQTPTPLTAQTDDDRDLIFYMGSP